MKKIRAIFVSALCFLLVAAVQMPYKTTVSAEPFSSFESGNKNYPEGLNDAISTHLFDTESSYPTFVNSVYIVREEYLIKKDKTTYFIPYIMADVRDVWTAGMSTWGFWLNTLVVEEDGTTTINTNKKCNRSASIFTVEADPNTVIWEGAFRSPFKNVISIDLDKNEWVAMDEHVFFVGAATLDSSKPRNTDSVVSFKWESAFTVGIGKKIPFVVEGGSAYINNYKYENSDEWFSDLFDESARAEDEKHYREELRNSVSFEEIIDEDALPVFEPILRNQMETHMASMSENLGNYIGYELTRFICVWHYENPDGSVVELYDFNYALLPETIESVVLAGGMYFDSQLRVQGVNHGGPLAVRYDNDRITAFAFMENDFIYSPGDTENEAWAKEMVNHALAASK